MDNLAEDEGAFDLGEVPPPPPKRERGRPPLPEHLKKNPKKTVTVTRQEFVDDGSIGSQEPDAKDDSFAAIFDSEDVLENSVVRVRVTRKDPDEGMLGYLEDPTSTVSVISERWGGGVYQLVGLDRRGKVTRGGIKTVKLAGDPIFMSTAAEVQWKRSKGILNPAAPTTPLGLPGGMSFQEMMALQQASEDKRRAEEREHAKLMRQMELDAEEKKRRDEDDRRRLMRAEEEERETRRRKDDEERDARRRREQQEAEARQQQFMQQTIQMIQASSTQALQFAKAESSPAANSTNQLMEAMKAIAMIKDTFGGGGGDSGEPEDTMQTLFKNLPAILNGAGGAIGSAIREVKGGPGAPQLAAAPSPLAMIPAGSPLAGKLEALVIKIAEKGGDPEKVLTGLADGVIATLDGKSPQVAAQPSASVNPQPVHREAVAEKPKHVSTAVRITFGKKSHDNI